MLETKSLEGGITRRGFLKTTGAVAAATAAAGAGSTLVSLADADVALADEVAEETTFRSQCRGNCGSRCPLKVTVREGRAVKVEAQEYPEPYAKYRRLCVKGYSQPQRVYDPDRLKYPLMRTEGAERGAGDWTRVDWDTALGMIAQKMGAAIQQYGGSSIAFWSSYGSYGSLNGAMAGYMSMAYGRFSTCLGCTILGAGADTAQQHVQSSLLGNSGSDFAQAANSKTIVAWGGNPAEAYVHAWQFICDAREKGARLITIDPQFTASAMHSDLYVPIIPGTDGAMMLAMCNYIIANDLMDKTFMKNNSVSPYLVKEDGTYLRMSDFGVTPAEGPVSSTTGRPTVIDPVVVWDDAAGRQVELSQATDPALEGEFVINGVTYKTVFQTTKEYIAEWTMEKASEICGVDVATMEELARVYATEGPLFTMTFQGLGHHVNSHHNFKSLAFLHALTGNASKDGAAICGNPAPFSMLPFNAAAFFMGYGTGPSFCGMYLPDVVESKQWAGEPLDIRVLWMCNGNVLSCESGRLELIEAVKKIDFVVCADVSMTDSAQWADVVLPIPHAFEMEDIDPVGSTPFPAYYQPGLEPLYECKADIQIMRELATMLQMDFLYAESDQDLLRKVYSYENNGVDVNKMMHLDYDSLATGAMIPNMATQPANLSPIYGPEESTRFAYYIEKPTPRNSFGQEIAAKEKLPHFEFANESYMDNPLRAKYPLFGCSEHNKYHVHSQLAYTPVIRELEPVPFIKINPVDADARGIKQGDTVRIFNDRGFAKIKAVVTEGIMPGVICIPHGFQAEQFIEGHTQDLTNRYMNDFCSNSAFYDFLCEVEKA